MIVILLNMTTMAMEHHDEPRQLTVVLNFINQLFIAVFALECVMKPGQVTRLTRSGHCVCLTSPRVRHEAARPASLLLQAAVERLRLLCRCHVHSWSVLCCIIALFIVFLLYKSTLCLLFKQRAVTQLDVIMVNTNLTSFVVLVNWHAHYVVIIELICSTLCRPTLCTMLICFCV